MAQLIIRPGLLSSDGSPVVTFEAESSLTVLTAEEAEWAADVLKRFAVAARASAAALKDEPALPAGVVISNLVGRA